MNNKCIEEAEVTGYLICNYNDFEVQEIWKQLCYEKSMPCVMIYKKIKFWLFAEMCG